MSFNTGINILKHVPFESVVSGGLREVTIGYGWSNRGTGSDCYRINVYHVYAYRDELEQHILDEINEEAEKLAVEKEMPLGSPMTADRGIVLKDLQRKIDEAAKERKKPKTQGFLFGFTGHYGLHDRLLDCSQDPEGHVEIPGATTSAIAITAYSEYDGAFVAKWMADQSIPQRVYSVQEDLELLFEDTATGCCDFLVMQQEQSPQDYIQQRLSVQIDKFNRVRILQVQDRLATERFDGCFSQEWCQKMMTTELHQDCFYRFRLDERRGKVMLEESIPHQGWLTVYSFPAHLSS